MKHNGKTSRARIQSGLHFRVLFQRILNRLPVHGLETLIVQGLPVEFHAARALGEIAKNGALDFFVGRLARCIHDFSLKVMKHSWCLSFRQKSRPDNFAFFCVAIGLASGCAA